MCTIVCGGVELECSDLVRFLESKNGECSRQELLDSAELKSVAKQYSNAIGNSCDIPGRNYEWFADVVVGTLVLCEKVQVRYDFTKISEGNSTNAGKGGL